MLNWIVWNRTARKQNYTFSKLNCLEIFIQMTKIGVKWPEKQTNNQINKQEMKEKEFENGIK